MPKRSLDTGGQERKAAKRLGSGVWEEQERGEEEFSVRHGKCGGSLKEYGGVGEWAKAGTLWEVGWELLVHRSCRSAEARV